MSPPSLLSASTSGGAWRLLRLCCRRGWSRVPGSMLSGDAFGGESCYGAAQASMVHASRVCAIQQALRRCSRDVSMDNKT